MAEVEVLKHKSLKAVGHSLSEIDKQLETIKIKGRQVFLESQPENFSRIMHDYSNDRKGFIIWKGLLEEQIV